MQDDDPQTDDEPPREASHLRENTDQDQEPEDGGTSDVTRRAILGGTVAILGTGGWLAYAVERAKAAAAGVIGTSTNPYTRAYVTTVNFEDLGADPSSPDDGTMWYNSNA
jgi:hypothetical protein